MLLSTLEIQRVIGILSRRTKNNPVLIGSPGVGKTAIAEGLAMRIFKGDVPSTLKNCRVVSLDLGSLLAGASMRGQFEERMKAVLAEVMQTRQLVCKHLHRHDLCLNTRGWATVNVTVNVNVNVKLYVTVTVEDTI